MSIEAQNAENIKSIDEFLAKNESKLIDLVVSLIAIDSQIPPESDEQEIAEFIKKIHLDMDLGEISILGPTSKRPSVFTRISGSKPLAGKNLMLNGHIDTKPVGGSRNLWRTDPFQATLIDGNIFGLGSNDMKAAVAAMTYAALAIKMAGISLEGDLLLAFVADEEGGASKGSKYLAPLLENIDCGLIGEPSGWTQDWQGIHLVSRGVCCFRIQVKGTQKHSSLSDRLPNINASLKMADLLNRISSELKFTYEVHPLGNIGPTLNPGVMVSGGTFFGVIPGEAEFACDLRTVPGMTFESVQADIQKWLDYCKVKNPELDVKVIFEPDLSWVPWCEIPVDHRLVGVTQSSAKDVLGFQPPLSVFPGGTDAAWFSEVGIPTLASFGPGMLTSAHGPNEFVSRKSILEAARIYARIVVNFCG